ncbi:MAG: ArsR family transcriptional regulator [Proteobacteria bacterium]|nr:ArsR family transcriptional regulator [Pseudomonadota bacterium]
MKTKTSQKSRDVVTKLSAIAHEGRLSLLRRLIQAGPSGMAAGELSAYADIGAPTASAQLLVLSNARLVRSQRQGRQIIYFADYKQMTSLLAYLMEDCCGGEAKICLPLAAALSS